MLISLSARQNDNARETSTGLAACSLHGLDKPWFRRGRWRSQIAGAAEAVNRVAYLQTGKSDLTISSLGKTPERNKVIDFSIAYSPFFDAVFGAKSPPIKEHKDLAGIRSP